MATDTSSTIGGRLSAWAKVASGLAHELADPLNAAALHLGHLKRKWKNPEPEVARREAEERVPRAGQRAPGERDADGPGRRVAAPAEAFDLVEVRAGRRRRTEGLEHREVARDAPASLDVRCGCHVVRHRDDPGVDALGTESFGGQTEVHGVACVVPERQDDAATLVCGLRDRVDLGGRRGREDVADHGAAGRNAAI